MKLTRNCSDKGHFQQFCCWASSLVTLIRESTVTQEFKVQSLVVPEGFFSSEHRHLSTSFVICINMTVLLQGVECFRQLVRSPHFFLHLLKQATEDQQQRHLTNNIFIYKTVKFHISESHLFITSCSPHVTFHFCQFQVSFLKMKTH